MEIEMGEGSFGTVVAHGDVVQKTGKPMGDTTRVSFLRELRYCTMPSEIAQRYIVRAYQMNVTGTVPSLVMEKGISDAHDLRPEFAPDCVYDVWQALRYLQSLKPPICHRDVKASNVIMFQRGSGTSGTSETIYKLGDFGFAGPEKTFDHALGTYPNPVFFYKSELMGEPHLELDDFRTDMYALCCMVLQLNDVDVHSLSNDGLLKRRRLSEHDFLASIEMYLMSVRGFGMVNTACEIMLAIIRGHPYTNFDLFKTYRPINHIDADPIEHQPTVHYICEQMNKLGAPTTTTDSHLGAHRPLTPTLHVYDEPFSAGSLGSI